MSLPKKILIADDNLLVRKLLRIMLERDGRWAVCGEASDGQEAVLRAQESRPDAAILDLAMPVMDGLDAARQITKMLPSTPIVLFTLYSSPEIVTAAKEAGIQHVLPKTASGAPLIRVVEDLFARKSESSGGRPEGESTTMTAAAPSSLTPMMQCEPIEASADDHSRGTASPNSPPGPVAKAD